MKSSTKTRLSIAVLFTLLLWFMPTVAYCANEQAVTDIFAWEQQWELDGDWLSVDSSKNAIPTKPKASSSVSIRITLPQINDNDGLYISKLYANQVQILENGKEIYTNARTYKYDIYRILVPLDSKSSGKTILIHAKTDTDRLGLFSPIVVGNYQRLEGDYVKANLNDVFLGCSFLFVSFIMLLSAIFLNHEQRRNWLSLSIMIMAIGVLMITYSPFLFTFYGQYGPFFYSMFDLALFFFLPALTYFFENIFGAGYFAVFRKLRKFQIGYSIFCCMCSMLNLLTHYNYFDVYLFFTVTLLGVVMVIQFLLIIVFTIIYALKGNIEARILSIGMGIFAIIGIGELVWFYLQAETYDFKLWKLGMLAFIGSLIILLGRKMAATHRKMVQYSKELATYNLKIQRSEKMDVIGQLAASVAHEVRNPLQVSRGFLQLLGERLVDEKAQGFTKVAIEELDRAAEIIKNYLSFATPELDTISRLNLAKEFAHVEQIIVPFADTQGARIEFNVPSHLHLHGNDAKLKQIFINMMKNSLEALGESGVIRIWAFEHQGEIVIHLHDNGEGMDENVLQRLGEPYFSNKVNGTGLGLMVTFRIIELMNGKLEFKSEKGVGTEAIIRFPAS
ncbi:signal transduction histidine kinase [Paenibacillus baekrokdamisoli]|uniref:sensor histidine kinase n=1 Tax=Paenibacillus baekrokdamisoli TaxID=1712516 RepID=UPI000F791B7D|nr:sensor histidine kinase [Paenibacillus baekrokdamisoli]MBB3070840.1 signal transduction histidine kinase [Paenibacillus baekrokdamisoli]